MPLHPDVKNEVAAMIKEAIAAAMLQKPVIKIVEKIVEKQEKNVNKLK